MPVWLSAYHYGGKIYHLLINARTGEVQGERPYSAWKIAVAVAVAIVLILLIALIAAHK